MAMLMSNITTMVPSGEGQPGILPGLAKRIDFAIADAEGHARSARDTAPAAGTLAIEARDKLENEHGL